MQNKHRVKTAAIFVALAFVTGVANKLGDTVGDFTLTAGRDLVKFAMNDPYSRNGGVYAEPRKSDAYYGSADIYPNKLPDAYSYDGDTEYYDTATFDYSIPNKPK
jgi:hypothetical protein